jgi:hypothetical protein
VPAASAEAPVPTDWQNDVDYEKLIHTPAVRDLLARQKPEQARMTGEEFVGSFEKIIKSPVALVPAMTIMRDIYGRMGIHTGKTREEKYPQPVGRVIVSALCGIAKSGYKVQDVRQASDGCMLICEIPSDMFSLSGQLFITIRRELEGTSVQADTHIEGQLYDWGKSKRALDNLFAEIAEAK